MSINQTMPDPKGVTEAIGCCFSIQHAKHVLLEQSISQFLQYCTFDQFRDYMMSVGFDRPSFRQNPSLVDKECRAWIKFKAGYHQLPDEAVLGLVFHGTAKTNIPSILGNGLDPKRRKGQVYGAGEYFSKEPGVSVGFSKGAKEMLVFAVVVTGTNPKVNCPMDYVVVQDNHRQIPLGTISYSAVDNKVLRSSQRRRAKFSNLRRNLIQETNRAKEATTKATIKGCKY